jgi:acetoin utilization deacetylase AcuC-like enzyme
MKIVYHPRYEAVYDTDPAAAPGRMESVLKEVSPHFELVKPTPATQEDVLLVHSEEHLSDVERAGLAYEIALLAAGGAIKASEIALAGEPAFGLIRPPGHHASPESCWGFCFFNNMAISVAKLLTEGRIGRAAILDIDLHFGDGTANTFEDVPEVVYFHPKGMDRGQFVKAISEFLAKARADIVAVSAGFDRHEDDWGCLLATEDYRTIGHLVKQFAEKECGGRRYGVLEGGYNHDVLGANVRALLEGMR